MEGRRITELTPEGFKKALKDNGGPSCKALLKDAKAYKSTFDLLKPVAQTAVAAQKKDVTSIVFGLIAGTSATTSGFSAISKAAYPSAHGKFRADSITVSGI